MDVIIIILTLIFSLMLITALFKFGMSILKGIWNVIAFVFKGVYKLIMKIVNNGTIPKR